MFKRLLATGLIFGMCALAPPALAASCAEREVMVKRLAEKYNERLALAGLQHARPAQKLMEVWASDATGSFTVIVTSPAGIACIVATGTDYFVAAPDETLLGEAS